MADGNGIDAVFETQLLSLPLRKATGLNDGTSNLGIPLERETELSLALKKSALNQFP